MINYFNGLARSGITDSISIYDRYREEYILTTWRKYTEQTIVESVGQLVSSVSLGMTFTGTIPVYDGLVTVKFSDGTTASGRVTNVNGSFVNILVTTSRILTTGITVEVTYSIPETLAWNEPKKRWTTFYSFTPECYGILGTELFSFNNGAIYVHDKNATRNNFYGTQYKTKVTPVFNINPELVKVWNACTLKTKQADNGNDWSAPIIRNDNGQLSRLRKGAWVKKEENWYAYFKRDLNTVAVTDPIVNGRALRSSSLICEQIGRAHV